MAAGSDTIGGDTAWIMTPVIRLPGRDDETVRPREVAVSAGFFSALQIPWIAGRDFLPEEIASKSPSVIVELGLCRQILHRPKPARIKPSLNGPTLRIPSSS